MKKLTNLVCALLCSLTLVPFSAQAKVVEGSCGDNLNYSYDTETQALTITGTGDMYDYGFDTNQAPWSAISENILSVSLPTGLTRIGARAFCYTSSLQQIDIPSSVTHIGYSAFSQSGIRSLSIPEGVTVLERDAFMNCNKLRSVELPNSLTTLDAGAFAYCYGLRSVTLGENIDTIGSYVFMNDEQLTSIHIPSSVLFIGGQAFQQTGLTTLILDPTTPPTLGSNAIPNGVDIYVPCSAKASYESAEGWEFYTLSGKSDYALTLSATNGGETEVLHTDCSSAIIHATIADSLNYHFVGWSDGVQDNPRTLTLTQDTTLTAVFEPYPYYTVTLQGSNLYVEYEYVNSGSSWYWIGTNSTYDSNISLSIREGLRVYMEEQGSSCGNWIGWSDGVTDRTRYITITQDTTIRTTTDANWYHVQATANEGGRLEGNMIDGYLSECDNYWYVQAIPEEGYFFTGWNDLPADHSRLYLDENGKPYIFGRSMNVSSDSSIVALFAAAHQVQLQVGVDAASAGQGTVIGGGTYMQGDYPTISAIPNSGYHFVAWSDGVSTAERAVYLVSDSTLTATFAQGDFGGKCGENLYWTWANDTLTITGTGDMDIANYTTWRDEGLTIRSLSMPEGMTSIAYSAFYGQQLTEVTIPASVLYIGDLAFDMNYSLTRFVCLGNEVSGETTIFNGNNITYFQGNPELLGEMVYSFHALDTVIVTNGSPYCYYFNNITYVDNRNSTDSWNYTIYQPYYVKTVQTVLLPNAWTKVPDYALTNARSLKAITIPANITCIGVSAFEDCRSMDSVAFAGKNVETIDDWAFYNCHSLRSISLPEGVETVGEGAFFDCVVLNELTIPSTMQTIADNAFAGCEKIGRMYVNALVPPTIEEKTFDKVNRATPVFVPHGTMELYQADQYWSEFFNMAEYDAPSGNLNISTDGANGLRKELRDGQVLIIRGDKTYSVLGNQW